MVAKAASILCSGVLAVGGARLVATLLNVGGLRVL